MTAAGISLCAFAANAGDATSTSPSIKMNGVLRTLAVATNQKIRTNKGVEMNTYGNVTINAGGMARNGLNYGALAVLQLDRSKKNTDKITEAYLYLNSDAMGSVQFGDTHGVSSLMLYDATDVMGGTGGFDANLDRQLNVTRGVNFAQNIGHVPNGSSRATKISYMSPEVSGFQVGVSYTPNTSQHGRSFNTNGLDENGNRYKDKDPYAVNHLEGAVSYSDDIGPYSVGLYLVGALGKAHGPRGTATQGENLHPVKAWQFGTIIDYNNWQFGAGYFDNCKSYMRRSSKYTNTHGFNVAVGYGFGPMSLALGHTGTERKVTAGKAKADISSFTVDYAVADGLAVYGEATYFKFKAPASHIRLESGTNANQFQSTVDVLDRQPTTNKGNQGTAFVLGTRVNF